MTRSHAFSRASRKAPAKRSQHANATFRNIVGRNMLRAFGHPVATCCDVLGVVGSNLAIFKLEPTTPNTSQHGGQMHATCCAQQCCDMLRWHVAIVWPGLKLHALASSFDWLNRLSVSFVIGQSNYFFFGFTTFNGNPPLTETHGVYYGNYKCTFVFFLLNVPYWIKINKLNYNSIVLMRQTTHFIDIKQARILFDWTRLFTIHFFQCRNKAVTSCKENNC